MMTFGRRSFDPMPFRRSRAEPGFAATELDAVRRSLYSSVEHTFARPTNPGGADADGTATGDLGLPRRVRRRARLSPDRTGDRRGRRPGLTLDGACPPRQPRACRTAQARSDQAAGARARRPRTLRDAAGDDRPLA